MRAGPVLLDPTYGSEITMTGTSLLMLLPPLVLLCQNSTYYTLYFNICVSNRILHICDISQCLEAHSVDACICTHRHYMGSPDLWPRPYPVCLSASHLSHLRRDLVIRKIRYCRERVRPENILNTNQVLPPMTSLCFVCLILQWVIITDLPGFS